MVSFKLANLPQLVAGLCLLALGATPAMAQSSSMFGKGGSGSFGGMNMSQLMSQFGGMGGSGGMSGGMGGMSGGMGGMSGGMSGMSGGMSGGMGGMSGGSGVSGNNFGGSRAGTGFGANSGGMGMQGQGQGNFVGRNANQFVGMNAMTGGNMQGMNGGRQGLNGNRGGNNLNGMQNFNQNGGQQQQLIPLRAQQRVAFDYQRPSIPMMQNQVQTRFDKVTVRNPAFRGVTFAADPSGSVVLRGEVKSQAAARVAEKLARLEPGVKSVRSELTFPASTIAE